MTPAKNRSLALLLILIVSVAAAVLLPVLAQAQRAPHQELREVWQRVQEAGAYRFSADIVQTTTPQATVANAGRASRQTQLYLKGESDRHAETLRLSLWSQGGSVMDPSSALEIHVAGAQAMARTHAGAWEEIDDFTGLFAPGGDLMAYTRAAENVANRGTEIRTTPLGDISVTRYTFDVNGRFLAENMRAHFQEQAVAAGLPAHVSVDLTKAYVGMTGTGELWVDGAGLPLRQIFDLTFPPDAYDYATSAAITVDFSDFTPSPGLAVSHPAAGMALVAWTAVSRPQALAAWVMAGLGLLVLALALTRRRSRYVYTGVTTSVILSMLVVPLLSNQRIYAYSVEQLARQNRTEALRADAETQAELEAELATARIAPNAAPLVVAQQLAAASDPPSRYYDDRCESDPDSDIDGDTLTNLEECLLGTLLDAVDSDSDGADDGVEVTGVEYNGKRWYTDPLNQDTNQDGLVDSKEWFTDPDNDGAPVLDTDNDGTPDMWDEDNDGDGVIDRLDISPYISTRAGTATAKTFTDAAPMELTLAQLAAGELVKVEFQLRPENADHLWYSQNVLDWPEGDLQGNIQDADGKTFFDVDSTTPPSPNANGDVRIVPMLEIRFANTAGNLPPVESCTDDDGNSYPCYPLLEDFGISVTTVDDSTSVAFVPLQLVTDPNGDANTAFYGRMFYQASGSWATPHQVRLVWAVQALNDVCAAYTNNVCSEYSAYNDVQLVHTYYDDWYLTGLHLTEEHSANIALVYEDPAETAQLDGGTDAPFYLDVQYGLLYGLDQTFLAGRCSPVNADGTCPAGATRDFTVSDIYTRFNHTSNAGVSADDRWNLPNVLSVVEHEYEALDLGMSDTTITQTVSILNDHFTAAWTVSNPITPTIMVAYEQEYRDLNLDEDSVSGDTRVAWSGNGLTLGLPQSGADAVDVSTMVSLKWTPYNYDPATGWAAADIQVFWVALNDQWGPSFVDPDNPGQADTYQTMAQQQYMAVYNGTNTVVQTGDIPLPAPYQAPDKTVAEGIGIDTTKFTLKVMRKIYKYSDDLEEVADYLRNSLPESAGSVSRLAVGEFLAQKANKLSEELSETGAIVAVTLVVIVAMVALATYFVSRTVHNTGISWTYAITAGVLMTAFFVISPLISYVKLLDRTIIAASEVGETISYGTALLRTVTVMKTLSDGAKVLGVIGLLVAISVAVGFFIAAWANGSAKPGSVAFNEGLALTIASVVVAVVLFVIGLFVLGGILVGILAIIDLILTAVGVKWTITGTITKALASIIYQYNVFTEQNQQTGALENSLTNPAVGLTAGNQISFTLPITTTLTQSQDVIALSVPPLQENSLVYSLTDQPESLSTSLNAGIDWILLPPDQARYTAYPTTQIGLDTGINTQLPLQLNAGWALTAQSCWTIFCSEKPLFGSSSTAINDGLIFDIFPETLDEFVDTSASGWAKGQLSTVDADGDGLLAQRGGGLDPDDTQWDTDGDGLADRYELTIRSRPPDEGGLNLDPRHPDGDGDLISDATELFYGTNPDNGDSDDDGIPDIDELPYIIDVNGELNVAGWALPYAPGKTTLIWSNPLLGDSDGDGLSDLFERTQVTCPTCTPWVDPSNPAVFNPNVWNISPVALSISDSSTDGYVLPGATVAYTSTTVNNLSAGQLLSGKISVNAPAIFTAENTEAQVNVTSGARESLVTTLQVNATSSTSGVVASTMELTDYEATVWSWDDPAIRSVTTDDQVQDVATVTPSGWGQAILLVTHELAENGIHSIVAYLAGVTGEISERQLLFTAAAGTTLTAPSIACLDASACLVAWAGQSGTNAFVWHTLMQGALPTVPVISEAWSGSSNEMPAPAAAGHGSTFMVVWATITNSTRSFLALPVDGNVAVNSAIPAATDAAVTIHTTTSDDLSSPEVEWNGLSYTALWTENESILRAQLDPVTGVAQPPVEIQPGRGWLTPTTFDGPPTVVYDPLSLQVLLLYQGPDAQLYAGRLRDDGSFASLNLDSSAAYGQVGARTAVCADPKNSGWVAAWSPPDSTEIFYQAVGPDGTFRGPQQRLSGNRATGIALSCDGTRPLLDLEFDEEAGAKTFADSSGYGHDAACTVCPESGVTGQIGNGVNFSQAVQYNLSTSFTQPTSGFTTEVWLRNPSIGGVYSRQGSLQGMYFFNDMICASVTQADNSYNEICSENPITQSDWHHFVHVGNADNHQIYVDGELVATSNTLQYAACSAGNCTDFSIGAFPKRLIFDYNGKMDGLSFYDRALSTTEIASNFKAASVIYDLDDVAGSIVIQDASGNGRTAACAGDTCPTLGVPGVAYTAAQFDGDDFYEHAGSLASGAFTISAWAKRNTTGADAVIVAQGMDIGGVFGVQNDLDFGFRDDDRFTCSGLTPDTYQPDILNTADAYPDTEWNHWACTYDAATKLRTIYRNGVLVAQATANSDYFGSANLTTSIGKRLGDPWYFDGMIDEIAIWGKALSAEEIVELYNKVKSEDQSVMIGTLAAANGTRALAQTMTILRETTTDVGVIAQTITRTLTVDADAPTVCGGTTACPQQDAYVPNTGTLVVAGTAEDPTSYISAVDVNDDGWQPATGTATWSYAWNIGALGDGEHTLPVRATDAVGHVSSIYDLGVVIDSKPPQATFASGDSAVQRPTRNDAGRWLVSLAGSVADPVAGSKAGSGVARVDVLLDGAGMLAGQGWQPATIDGTSWAIDYVLPGFDAASNVQTDPTGTYTVTLRATDAVSNTTPAGTYQSTQIRLDASGPAIAATAPLSNTQLITTALTILGTVEDTSAIAGVEVNFTPAEQVDALNGALVYHAFDEGQDSQYFDDLSGSGNAAVCDQVACPENGVTGQRDHAVRFNGVNQSLTIADNAAFDLGPDDDFTVAFWVKADATQPDTERADHSIVEKWTNDGGGYPFVVRYLHATGQVFGMRFDKTHDPNVTSVQSINDGQFHHVAFVKKGDYLYLYIDGEQGADPVQDTTTGNTTNSYPIYLGMRGGEGGTNHFAGTLDELLIYGRALADYEIANLVAFGQASWNAATIAGDAWSYVVPEGSDGIEGLYQINARGIDALGNATPLGGQRLWRGEIDTRPPDVKFSATSDESGATSSTQYECQATDFNLDEASSCISSGNLPIYRPSDITPTTYSQVDEWYAATISETARLYAIDAVRVYSGTAQSGLTMTACDLYSRCATTAGETALAALRPAGGEILLPSANTSLTSTAAITVVGDAYAVSGLHTLVVQVNEKPAFIDSWLTNEVTAEPWSFVWTPPGEGVYRFVPHIIDWGDDVPPDYADPQAVTDYKPESVEVPDLPPAAYLPLAASDGSPLRAQSGGSGPTVLYLPIVEKVVALTGGYVGTAAIIYVDRAPPVVTLDKSAWSRADALGAAGIELTGTVSDSVGVHRVDVRIDQGPWNRAGVDEDGRWSWPWRFAALPDGETYQVTVRAQDLAGRTVEITQQVTVDLVAPKPADLSFAYVNAAGETLPMEPGERLTDAARFILSWGESADGSGPVRILAGFTRRPSASDDELMEFGGPDSLSQPVAVGERWFAIVRTADSADNAGEIVAGPFYSFGAEQVDLIR